MTLFSPTPSNKQRLQQSGTTGSPIPSLEPLRPGGGGVATGPYSQALGRLAAGSGTGARSTRSATVRNPSRGKSGGFDFHGTYGSNPWSKATGQVSQLLSGMLGNYSAGPAGGSSSSAGSFLSNSPARPDDPAVREYMSHIMGGQRKAMQDYIRQAAGAGIQRSGLNVRGGPALDSALHQSAMKNLAAGYADRFREAMNYSRQQRAEQYSRSQDRFRDIQNLMNLQHRYLSSQDQRDTRLADLIYGDWKEQRDYERNAPMRELEMDRLRRAAQQQQWQDYQARRQTQRAEAEQSRLEQQYRKGLAKADARWGSPWTAADLMRMEEALVSRGIWNPLSRSIQMRHSSNAATTAKR